MQLQLITSVQFPPHTVSRFWSKIKKTSTCWLWTGFLNDAGYGIISIGCVLIRAHRFSWELHFSPIPDGLLVCHHCDNPPCVNPAHLFLGTKRDNARDMVAKGRHVVGGTHCGSDGKWKHGTDHWRAKMNEANIEELRNLRAHGWSLLALGQRFGITIGAVSMIANHKRWKHL